MIKATQSHLSPHRVSRFMVAVLVLALGSIATLGSEAFAQDKGQGPADMSADQVAERVQKFYKETDDYQARFKQTYTDVAAGSAKKSHGVVYFKKPGQMRWDYYKSADFKKSDIGAREKVLVSDGATFWIYEQEFKQVFKKCLAESQLPTSLKFLMGQGNLLEEFDVSFADASTAEQPVLELVPKEPTSKYSKLIFELDAETFQVQKTTVFDPYGNTNAINFQKAKINKNLPSSGFKFEAPKGARELNPQKECNSAEVSD
ncbi:MAG: LolA family protein [Persicimonas sp.]